jgi:hypothetical protein
MLPALDGMMRAFANGVSMLRLWLFEWSGPLGLMLAACIAAVFFVLFVPIGSVKEEQGTILNFGSSETDTGSYPLAVVALPRGAVTVPLPRAHHCEVGGRIRVQMQRQLWGARYISAPIPCR